MIEVLCNGKTFTGFSSVNVVKAIDSFSASYSLSVFKRMEEVKDGNFFLVPIFPGDEVEILLDGVSVIKGYNETTTPNVSANSVTCNISGRDVCCDAVDCPVEKLNYSNKKVDEIVRSVCAEFGLVYTGSKDADLGEALKKFNADPGATGYEVMIAACKERRLMPFSDGSGHVSIVGSNFSAASDDLVYGKNILSCSAGFNNKERRSVYKVVSSSDPKCKTAAEAIDDGVTRNRPWILCDERYSSLESCSARAMWEAKHRQAASGTMNVSVDGWMQKNGGGLWRPGLIVNVNFPGFFGTEVREFLINRVTYTLGGDGTVTQMVLVDPETYAPMPTVQAKKRAKVPKAKNDPWASVRKQTGSKLK